ncbi:MAG: hypothetical protein LBQ73_09795 [Tannerellaceae bacterium]|jgi:hypothetical protein|nr:hypothetical protein [Tannerellaceae bacterium]
MENKIHTAIIICNTEYQCILQQMFAEFNALDRINKRDMKEILARFSERELGEEVDLHLEQAGQDKYEGFYDAQAPVWKIDK